MKPKRLRKHLFVDQKIQGTLIFRVILYWGFCLASITLLLLAWRVVTGPARPIHMHFSDMKFHYAPPLIASFLLLPIVIADLIRVSNRFVGPMIRLRHAMRRLAQGEQVDPITFREGDFWEGLAQEFNELAARTSREQPSSNAPAEPALPDPCEMEPEEERELVKVD